MTVDTADMAGLVRCPCGKAVAPTLPGGTRPRAHLTPDDVPCTHLPATTAVCKRCGGAPDAAKDGCTSAMFHPAVWRTGDGTLVGNAAAAGAIAGVSGEQYGWLTRRPPEGPRRAPAPLGVDRARRASFYDLQAVSLWAVNRPGIPAPRG